MHQTIFTKEDYLNWEPFSIQEVIQLLSGLQIPWVFAGGYAIELFVGKSFPKHGDIDMMTTASL